MSKLRSVIEDNLPASSYTDSVSLVSGSVRLLTRPLSLYTKLVAEGMADVYPRLGPTMEWDTAAGQAIVEQAEGSVIDIQTKEPLGYNKHNLLNPFFIVTGRNPFPVVL